MPSPTEPLFLPDPDSPRFHHLSEPNGMSIHYSSHVDILTILLEPSAAASPQAASQQRPQVYVLIPHRPKAVGMWKFFLSHLLLTSWTAPASLDEAVKAAFSIFDSEEWKAVRWNEEDKRHIIGMSSTSESISFTYSWQNWRRPCLLSTPPMPSLVVRYSFVHFFVTWSSRKYLLYIFYGIRARF